MTAPTDQAALLGALVAILAFVAVGMAWLLTAVAVPLSGTEVCSTWSAPETTPLAGRAYLALCRSRAVESKQLGNAFLVECDAWVFATGSPPTSPAVAPSFPPAPTDEVMRAAGFAEALRLGLATDPATVLVTVIAVVVAAGMAWLLTAGAAAAPEPEAPSTWSARETSPLARRAYLQLCRSGTEENQRLEAERA